MDKKAAEVEPGDRTSSTAPRAPLHLGKDTGHHCAGVAGSVGLCCEFTTTRPDAAYTTCEVEEKLLGSGAGWVGHHHLGWSH